MSLGSCEVLCICPLAPYNSYEVGSTIIPTSKTGAWGLERLANLQQVMQLISGIAELQTFDKHLFSVLAVSNKPRYKCSPEHALKKQLMSNAGIFHFAVFAIDQYIPK